MQRRGIHSVFLHELHSVFYKSDVKCSFKRDPVAYLPSLIKMVGSLKVGSGEKEIHLINVTGAGNLLLIC